jgi:transposase
MASKYSPETIQRAHELHELGASVRLIHRMIGVPEPTLRRWLFPEVRERGLQKSRQYKAKHRGSCIDCGKSVWMTSDRCAACSQEHYRKTKRWTREAVIQAIKDWNEEHGHPPTTTEWLYASNTHPGATSVYGSYAEFRTWNEAIEAAGLTPRHTSPGPGKREWSLEEAHLLRQEGLSDIEIGKRFGVSASAIHQALGRRRKPVPRKRTREQRIADLQAALERNHPKGEHDGNRDRAGDNHD